MDKVKDAVRFHNTNLAVKYSEISHIDLANNEEGLTVAIVDKLGAVSRVREDERFYVWVHGEERVLRGRLLMDKLEESDGSKIVYDSPKLFFESLFPSYDVVKRVAFD